MTYDFKATIDFPEEAIEWKIVWHRMEDACEKCRELANYEFYGVGSLPQILVHPEYGPVWDISSNLPLTHLNCRCDVEPYVRVNWGAVTNVQSASIQLGLPPLVVEVEWLDVSQMEKYVEQVKEIRAEVGRATVEFRELEYVAYRIIGILGRLGLPPQIDTCLQKVSQLVLTVRMLHSALMFLETTTPYGLVMGIVTLIGAGITFSAAATIDARSPIY